MADKEDGQRKTVNAMIMLWFCFEVHLTGGKRKGKEKEGSLKRDSEK